MSHAWRRLHSYQFSSRGWDRIRTRVAQARVQHSSHCAADTTLAASLRNKFHRMPCTTRPRSWKLLATTASFPAQDIYLIKILFLFLPFLTFLAKRWSTIRLEIKFQRQRTAQNAQRLFFIFISDSKVTIVHLVLRKTLISIKNTFLMFLLMPGTTARTGLEVSTL